MPLRTKKIGTDHNYSNTGNIGIIIIFFFINKINRIIIYCVLIKTKFHYEHKSINQTPGVYISPLQGQSYDFNM